MLITGTGALGSAVLSSGNRPWAMNCCTCSAAGPVVPASAQPKPLDSTTIAWCNGTLTSSPTLPSAEKPSVAAFLMVVNREGLRPDDVYVSAVPLMKVVAWAFCAAGSHL